MSFIGTASIDVVWGGKLPSHGDFVWSNPRSRTRVALEDWLQAGMLQGRSQLGDAWVAQLAQAPTWNLLLPRAIAGGDKVIVGCMAPSVDRVGRRYPFVVAYALSASELMTSTAVLMELPTLLNMTGHQLHSAIQRALPRSGMDELWGHVIAQWRSVFPVGGDAVPAAGSEILELLAGDIHVDSEELRTRPVVRGTSYPWPDMAKSLREKDCPSFWWTHPAGGAPLKAFSYESGLDGTLMTWLVGRNVR
ncbi:type VI secretion system-associated protein TagF [Comamonas sp. MYb21]|uniref:type VI secretion system-associated protein TagF n=1 Tax=Comamonas sp. MYb21 TaxID=1848648 RepID=UPI0028B0234B|nr:type VI secretion system-associated protein TagF [Comamonas koreensis]